MSRSHIEERLLDLILNYRALVEEASGTADQGKTTGFSQELALIENDIEQTTQMLDARVKRLRERMGLYQEQLRRKRHQAVPAMNHLLELPTPTRQP